jgi:uncharacterized protein YkwD
MRSVAPILCGLTAVLAFLLAVDRADAARRGGMNHALLAAMNRARAIHGAAPLHPSRRLSRAARLHSGVMARSGVFSHGAFSTRVRRYTRARVIGENLAWVPRCHGTSGRVVRMWLASPAHRHILLAHAFHRVGLGARLGRVGTTTACLVTADFSS